jgi:hypothetical protein
VEKLSKAVTGVVVTYNTEKLFRIAYESVRSFLPKMPIVIVDGSEPETECFRYVHSLSSDPLNNVVQVRYNVGHGRGMCIGFYYVDTPHILLFDSDIEMIKNPLKEMNNLLEADSFGAGRVQKTGFDGFDYKGNGTSGFMLYLHPYFALIQKKVYKQFYPFVHHGAPCVYTMLDIHKRGLSNKILKSFDLDPYVIHKTAGTRGVIRSRSVYEIEGCWEANKGQI